MSSNSHVLEERIMNNGDDSGVNEEDKYVAYLVCFPVMIY